MPGECGINGANQKRINLRWQLLSGKARQRNMSSSKQLTNMSSSNATPWVNEGRSRKGKGRKWNTNLTIKDVDDTQS